MERFQQEEQNWQKREKLNDLSNIELIHFIIDVNTSVSSEYNFYDSFEAIAVSTIAAQILKSRGFGNNNL